MQYILSEEEYKELLKKRERPELEEAIRYAKVLIMYLHKYICDHNKDGYDKGLKYWEYHDVPCHDDAEKVDYGYDESYCDHCPLNTLDWENENNCPVRIPRDIAVLLCGRDCDSNYSK